jgi:hypothetical protein
MAIPIASNLAKGLYGKFNGFWRYLFDSRCSQATHDSRLTFGPETIVQMAPRPVMH